MFTEVRSWRRTTAVAAAGAAAAMALVAGCKNIKTREENAKSEAAFNTAIVQMHFDEQARAGAVTSRTIHAHHFATDQVQLTPLGEEHVQTIALALAEPDGKPVRLNVRRGEASAELYDARVAQIKERLADAGVPAERVIFGEGLSGGKGISSKSLADSERAAASSGRRGGIGGAGGGSSSMGGPTGPGTGYQSGTHSQGGR